MARHERVTYRSVLRNREFRGLFLAELLSVVGDQVARIAIALLVYARDGSALLAAATYACSYLVWLVAGPMLSALADRYPRRGLMVSCDLARAAAIAVLLVPHVPLVGVFSVLAVVALLSPPFESARSALLPDVLGDEAYTVGNALQNSVFTIGQAIGFAVGGALVAAVGVRAALVTDVASFLLSAAVVGVLVHARTSTADATADTSLWGETVAGARLVAGQPNLRWLLSVACVGMGVTITTEGLAVPTAAVLHGGPTMAGMLSAAAPAGYVAGAFVIARLDAEQRRRALLPLLAASAGPLLLSRLADNAVLLAALWLVAGAAGALQVVANAEYVLAVPPEARGRAFGLASAALMGTQGLVLLAAGALSEAFDPRTVVAVLAALGLLVVPALVHSRPHASQGPQGLSVSRRSPPG